MGSGCKPLRDGTKLPKNIDEENHSPIRVTLHLDWGMWNECNVYLNKIGCSLSEAFELFMGILLGVESKTELRYKSMLDASEELKEKFINQITERQKSMIDEQKEDELRKLEVTEKIRACIKDRMRFMSGKLTIPETESTKEPNELYRSEIRFVVAEILGIEQRKIPNSLIDEVYLDEHS